MQNTHGDIQTRTDRLARVVIDLKFKNIKLFTLGLFCLREKGDAQIALL